MVTKEILNQYSNTKKEIDDLSKKIEVLEIKIPKLEKRIAEIQEGHTVKDKVRGGNGGLQSFVIEGIPVTEYENKQTELQIKKRLLERQKKLLETLELELIRQSNEVETFLQTINDSQTRRIIRLRVIDGLSWNEVADKIGGGNTEDGVRMCFDRFLKKNISCSVCSL